MSPTSDDTPQQGDSLDSSQPDSTPFNPKEIAVDKSVPWQKSEPDSDGLSEHWEENQQIDINTDGLEVSGGGDEIYPDKYGRVKVQFQWDQEGEKGGDAPGHELVHTVQQGNTGAAPKNQVGDVSQHEVGHWMGDEGGVNDLTHKRPTRPAPNILAIIAILLLLLCGGLIALLGGVLTATNSDDATATSPPATDAPTETVTEERTPPSDPTDEPTAVVTESPPVFVATDPPAECSAGWLPVSGCTCCGTTLTCADGTVATFNPQCGVGDGSSSCTCVPTDPFCTNPALGCPYHCKQDGSACTP